LEFKLAIRTRKNQQNQKQNNYFMIQMEKWSKKKAGLKYRKQKPLEKKVGTILGLKHGSKMA
jgi:hypothetical protein